MLDSKKASQILKENGIEVGKFANPLKISLGMLETEAGIHSIVKRGMSKKYAQAVAEIWKPIPADKKEEKSKLSVMKGLPAVYSIISENLESLTVPRARQPAVSYGTMVPLFDSLDNGFAESEKEKSEENGGLSNPYLTVSIKGSLEEGRTFQLDARMVHSVETKWGNWIHRVIPKFNNSILDIGAGGFDCVLRKVAYDIKAGPNILNKSDIEALRRRREIIRNVSKTPDLKDLVKVSEFKVAVSYGRESGAGTFMKGQKGLIIFGTDAWRELTGNEWNAYRLFLWQIRYKVEKGGEGLDDKSAKWHKKALRESVFEYLDAFYDDPKAKLTSAFNEPEFKALEALLPE